MAGPFVICNREQLANTVVREPTDLCMLKDIGTYHTYIAKLGTIGNSDYSKDLNGPVGPKAVTPN